MKKNLLSSGLRVLVAFFVVGILIGQASDTEELVFPVVASGFLGPVVVEGDWGPRLENTFIFVNLSETTITGSFQFFENDGRSNGPRQLQVLSQRPTSFSFHFAALIPPTIPPKTDGWARLILPRGAKLLAENEIVFYRSSSRITSLHLQAFKPAREFRIAFVDRTMRVGRPAIAIVNPSSTNSVTVSLRFDKFESGFTSFLPCPTVPTNLHIPPLNRFRRFLDEICGPILGGGIPPATASLQITSDLPIGVAAIEVFPDGTFSTLVVRPLVP